MTRLSSAVRKLLVALVAAGALSTSFAVNAPSADAATKPHGKHHHAHKKRKHKKKHHHHHKGGHNTTTTVK